MARQKIPPNHSALHQPVLIQNDIPRWRNENTTEYEE